VANVRFSLGAEADICTTDEMHEGISSLRGDLREIGAKPKRILRPLSRAVTGLSLANGQSAHLFVGRPAAGRVWIVTRLTMLTTNDFDNGTNVVAAMYIGDDQAVALTQCVLNAQAIPFTSTQNEHAWICSDKESVFINITATGANTVTQVVGNVLVWEYRDKDILTQGI
jgi:hypothetical protein